MPRTETLKTYNCPTCKVGFGGRISSWKRHRGRKHGCGVSPDSEPTITVIPNPKYQIGGNNNTINENSNNTNITININLPPSNGVFPQGGVEEIKRAVELSETILTNIFSQPINHSFIRYLQNTQCGKDVQCSNIRVPNRSKDEVWVKTEEGTTVLRGRKAYWEVLQMIHNTLGKVIDSVIYKDNISDELESNLTDYIDAFTTDEALIETDFGSKGLKDLLRRTEGLLRSDPLET